ncbi:MAG TPA: hypothetical protein VMV82_04680 [Candidatus Dormibacteraeota bacterium]|nr:hypothetical protein [Candidatus Dormibacteraeota bacterium]
MPLQVELVPLLQRERELYAVPRGRERFDAYVKAMTDETGEAVLPLTVLNPMGREHVAELLDRMIDLGVERVAAQAAAQAQERLAGVDDSVRVAIAVADDLKGGWTNRYFTEMANRFERRYEVARGWATVLFWTSEEPTLEHARRETLGAICRTVHERKHGPARTLRAMMEQEGEAAHFAGERVHLDDAALRDARRIIEPLRESTAYPAIVAALYGDEAAASLGYPPLGLPARAGYAVALAQSRDRPSTSSG